MVCSQSQDLLLSSSAFVAVGHLLDGNVNQDSYSMPTDLCSSQGVTGRCILQMNQNHDIHTVTGRQT